MRAILTTALFLYLAALNQNAGTSAQAPGHNASGLTSMHIAQQAPGVTGNLLNALSLNKNSGVAFSTTLRARPTVYIGSLTAYRP